MRLLEDIIEDFENTRVSFNNYRDKNEVSDKVLVEYQSRFANLKSDLRPYKAKMTKGWITRDDKAASAIKFRIALAVHRGELKDEKGSLIYDECSINQAEKFASGSDKYKEFVDQRAFYKESLTNISDLRNDCDTFINLIKDILKTV